MRIVVLREVGKRCHLAKCLGLYAVRQFVYAGRHHHLAAGKGSSEGVVELTNPIGAHRCTTLWCRRTNSDWSFRAMAVVARCRFVYGPRQRCVPDCAVAAMKNSSPFFLIVQLRRA